MSPPKRSHRAAGRRRRRRRPPALTLILVIGVLAIAAAVSIGITLEDDGRTHGTYMIGAWTFGDTSSLAAAVDAGAIDEVSVDWLQSKSDGSVAAPHMNADFIGRARAADCRVFVTLTDYSEDRHTFDEAISAGILASEDSRRRHAAAVAEWCRTNDVDGVDVDWEAVKGANRDAFTAFIAALAAMLHADGRLIAVDVYPKVEEPGGWDGPRGQNWKQLGELVDQFRIMTYNYSGSWSGPGPLSPPDWMSRVLDFAEGQVPPEKIVMGLGFYGRDWLGSSTTDLLWNDLTALRADHAPAEKRTASGELRLDYRRDGQKHVAYFPDATAIAGKLEMMMTQHPRIQGVYAWCMGQEDPSVWKELQRALP